MVQEELGSTRKDKFMLQAKVGELRNSMRTLLQQNQQLKVDLKQGRLRKVGLGPGLCVRVESSVWVDGACG